MKNYTLLFLVMTLITGAVGFAGLNFGGIAFVRILFLIFADLLIVTLISKIFFPNAENMRLKRIKK